MEEYSYTLIVSQYYHSRHCFVVKHNPETFLQNAKEFVTELEKLKRGTERQMLAVNLGDLAYFNDDKIRQRYNINDSGDIYFINGNSANGLFGKAREYYEDSRREGQGFQRKSVTEAIAKHHRFSDVKEILEKYFILI